MTMLLRTTFLILCLSIVAFAIPLSLLEDAKELRLKSPARSNKVKRAQEVIMFGNQQNRGSESRGYNFPRTEKRAADTDDNALSDVATLPNILPQVEENTYETNQLDSASGMTDLDRAYQYGGEPIYNFQFRNPGLKEQYYNDPGFNDFSLYNIVDARRKREAKLLQHSYKLGLRNKRELDFNPDELLPLIKLWESERRNRFHDSRAGWPNYGIENEDYDSGEAQEDNEIDPDIEYMPNGHWLDGPIVHRPLGSGEIVWPRQHKRFMVSKRRVGEELLPQTKETPIGRIPLYRRFIL